MKLACAIVCSMTMTMTLTEFNQNPSRASRLAEQGDVRVTRRG